MNFKTSIKLPKAHFSRIKLVNGRKMEQNIFKCEPKGSKTYEGSAVAKNLNLAGKFESNE